MVSSEIGMIRRHCDGLAAVDWDKRFIHSTQIYLLVKELTIVVVLSLVLVGREEAEGCCLAVGVLNTSFLALLQGDVLFVVVGLPLVFIVSQLLKSDIT